MLTCVDIPNPIRYLMRHSVQWLRYEYRRTGPVGSPIQLRAHAADECFCHGYSPE
jgi:hypothetical protein